MSHALPARSIRDCRLIYLISFLILTVHFFFKKPVPGGAKYGTIISRSPLPKILKVAADDTWYRIIYCGKSAPTLPIFCSYMVRTTPFIVRSMLIICVASESISSRVCVSSGSGPNNKESAIIYIILPVDAIQPNGNTITSTVHSSKGTSICLLRGGLLVVSGSDPQRITCMR